MVSQNKTDTVLKRPQKQTKDKDDNKNAIVALLSDQRYI